MWWWGDSFGSFGDLVELSASDGKLAGMEGLPQLEPSLARAAAVPSRMIP